MRKLPHRKTALSAGRSEQDSKWYLSGLSGSDLNERKPLIETGLLAVSD